jgi:hypothetical protein
VERRNNESLALEAANTEVEMVEIKGRLLLGKKGGSDMAERTWGIFVAVDRPSVRNHQ